MPKKMYQNADENATSNKKPPMLARLSFVILLHTISTIPLSYNLSIHVGEVAIFQSISLNQHEGKGG